MGAVKDHFWHTIYSASRISAAQMAVNFLNEVGLSARGAARFNLPGADQRDNIIYVSTVDLEEAFRLGQHAVNVALDQGTGSMSTLVRETGPEYRIKYSSVPLEKMANS